MDKTELIKSWFKSTPEIIYFKDLEGKYIYVSDSCAKLAGLSTADELIGKYDYEVYPPEVAQRFIVQDKQVKKTGKLLCDTDIVTNKSMGNVVLETVKSPIFNENGEIIGIQGSARNITEKFELAQIVKNQDDNIKKIIDTVPFPMWIKNEDNKYIFFNKAYLDFYNVDENSLTGHNVETVLTVNRLFDDKAITKLDEHDNYVRETLKASKITVEGKIKNQKVKIEIIKTPIKFDNGRHIAIAGISHVLNS